MAAAPPPALCAQCVREPARYTCPACAVRTCSLPCSQQHKRTAPCTGVRNKAAFVPMNRYSYGALMSDYTFLEDLGRQTDSARRERSDGVDGGAASKGQKARERERILRAEMSRAGLGGVRWMPDGMAAKKLNQTRFNPKTRTLQLTIAVSAPSAVASPKVLHSLAPDQPLHALPSLAALPAAPVSSDDAPSAGSSDEQKDLLLLLPHPTSSPATLAFYAPAPLTPSPSELTGDPAPAPPATLQSVLRGRSWIEYPKFQLWPRTEWDTALAAGRVKVVEDEPESFGAHSAVAGEEGVKMRVWGKRPAGGDDEAEGVDLPEAKRPALESLLTGPAAGEEGAEALTDEARTAAIQEVLGLGGLLGDYGSESESGED